MPIGGRYPYYPNLEYLLFAKEAGTGGAVGHGEEGNEDLKGDKEVFRSDLFF